MSALSDRVAAEHYRAPWPDTVRGPVPYHLCAAGCEGVVLEDHGDVRRHVAEVAKREARADQAAEDLAMHHAFRPEVVAEVAVAVDDECSWEAIAAWCGGTIKSGPDGTDSGEWVSWIVIPGVNEVAGHGTWIVQRHDLAFDVRISVEGPSERSVAQVEARVLRDAAETLATKDFLLPREHAPMGVLVDWLRLHAAELERAAQVPALHPRHAPTNTTP